MEKKITAKGKEDLENLKLPSGAVVKVRRLTTTKIRYLVLKAMIEEFVEPGGYKLDEDGHIDPMNLLINDAKYIELWWKDPLGLIRKQLGSDVAQIFRDAQKERDGD